jgi:ferric-dicitrate binding protein FerR (iron transport regulator)
LKDQHQHNEYFLAEWLEGRISDDELRNLVGENDYNAYLKIRQASDVMQALSKPIKPVWEQIESRIEVQKIKKHNSVFTIVKSYMPYAAVLLVLLGLYQFLNIEQIEIRTAQNEQKTVWLPNGAQVILHDEAVLKYTENDWKNNPEIYLEGNAFIKSNYSNLFVHIKRGRIAISNSTIEINESPTLLSLICYQGQMKFTANSETKVIDAKQKLLIEKNAQKLLKTTHTLPIWLVGVSEFKNVALSKVVDSLEQFYKVRIERNNIDVAQKFTGNVPKYDLKLALFTVFKPMNIDYKVDNDHIILSEKKEND